MTSTVFWGGEPSKSKPLATVPATGAQTTPICVEGDITTAIIEIESEEPQTDDVDHARAVIEIAKDDVQQVYVRVTGVLGLAVVFVTQLPFQRLVGLPLWARWAFLAGLASAVGSAALYFHYLSKLHLARLAMARTVRDGRACDVEKIWAGSGTVWTEYGWAFNAGGRLMALSVGLLGLTLAVLLDLVP